MSNASLAPARRGVATGGLVLLAITSLAWGLSWPVSKYILSEWPPLPARGLPGLAGSVLLFAYAKARGYDLRVPRRLWGRLLASTFFNVTLWMVVMGLALLWLPAGETSVIAFTMPVWTALLAWPLLGERMNWMRALALVMTFAGVAALMGGNGLAASAAKLPGYALALTGALGFALGTIVLKRYPIALPGAVSAAWQIGIGCIPVALVGLAFGAPDVAATTAYGWSALAYLTLVQFCLAYLCWFAALERLPASVAAIGTMAIPVIGVVASAIVLREPLGLGQIAALALTLGGVALATRS